MAKLPKASYALVIVVLLVALTGCELRRTPDEASDLPPVEELPPTLAPLGSDSGEATAVPTVINVQPTATESGLGAGQAAENPAEPVAPTTQPVDLSASPETAAVETGAGEAEEAAVSPETFTAPVAESTTEESIIVDAATGDLPDGGPIAANPPASDTGDYGAPAAYGETSYTVQAGDTLFSIGLRYGVTPLAIMAANGLPSDVIQVGQVLVIPAEGDSSYYPPAGNYPAPAGSGTYHTVAPGETLFRIALTYGTSVDAIAGANGIPYPYLIQVGQQLVIPGPGDYSGPPPPPPAGYPTAPGYYPPETDNSYYPPAPNPGVYPAPGSANTHTVAPGETLFSIAQRYGLSAEAIAAANGLVNPNQIYVGQVLYLP